MKTKELFKRAGYKLPSKTQPKSYYDLDDDKDYVPVGVDGLLASTEKLLSVNRGLTEPDERDSWVYKRVYTPDRLMRLRIKMDAGKPGQKILQQVARRAARTKSLSAFFPGVFDSYTEGAIVSNPLSLPLEEINPLHLTTQHRRVTHMGPGGINSDDAITADMQNVNPSQFGFISPIEGPESARAGIDVRLAWGTKIGSDGRVYQRFQDRRSKTSRWLSPRDLKGLNVKIPD